MTYRGENYTGKYTADRWEKIGDLSLSTVGFFWRLSLYSSPLLAILIYRKGYMTVEGAYTLTRITIWLGILVGASFCLRSYGRASNPHYREFLTRLSKADSPSGVAEIKKYDFDFEAWPVEFHLPVRTWKPVEASSRSGFSVLLQSPCSLIGYMFLHTVGIRMIYPGSIRLINYLFKHALIDGRKILVVQKNGVRYKLKTPEGNTVDSMFIDRRGRSSGSKRGNILVICSEGNAGFYENGIMGTALEAGFSVLGWNHPGFGSSTGNPYINEEENAINTVMEFAIQRLEFPPSDIILFGWSIGGYSSSWAAAAYPSVRAVIADATFDDVLPLAINQMPGILESIVRLTVRSYADLNVARLLTDFDGKIKLVRRSEDEIIAIIPGDITTNRGNYLLKKILKKRYPAVLADDALTEWLSTTGSQQRKLLEEKNVNKEACQRIIDSYVYDHGPTFPFSELGKGMDQDIKEQITLYLAGEYMVDYSSTHCVPLPSSVFLSLVEGII